MQWQMVTSSYKLRPIAAHDVAECARVAGLAFENDRHTQLKARSPTNPYNHEEGMEIALHHWLSRPHGVVEMTAAIDDTTKHILGWVVWGYWGFESAAAEQQREPELRNLSDEKLHEPAPVTKAEPVEDSQDELEMDRLEDITDRDMATWMKRLMPPGTKCMFICSIVVHPQYQGRGVGGALLHKGTARADDKGVFCWVHASEAGSGLFAKHGFKEVGKLELDLDRWNAENLPAPEGDGGRWGSYTFRYMRRDAQLYPN